MRTVQLLGVPSCGLRAPDSDAIVIVLKARNFGARDFFTKAFDLFCCRIGAYRHRYRNADSPRQRLLRNQNGRLKPIALFRSGRRFVGQ